MTLDQLDRLPSGLSGSSRTEKSPIHLPALFLRGRKSIIKQIPFDQESSFTLHYLSQDADNIYKSLRKRYPNAIVAPFSASAEQKADIVLFSYVLSTQNPGWALMLEQAYQQLKAGGILIVIDFYASQHATIAGQFAKAGIRMEAHMQHKLHRLFSPRHNQVKEVLSGSWEYLIFVGEKTTQHEVYEAWFYE